MLAQQKKQVSGGPRNEKLHKVEHTAHNALSHLTAQVYTYLEQQSCSLNRRSRRVPCTVHRR
jgi:hypothetical protein